MRLLRQTGKYPVLVLNTDAQPLSYLPLSIIRWQEVGREGREGGREGGRRERHLFWYFCAKVHLHSKILPLLSLLFFLQAIKAIFLERVTVLAYYDSFIQSTAGPWQLPSVICLKQYQKGCRERPPPLNRRNIYIRDHYSCAYCTLRLKANDLTLDHVMPRSKGGKGSWDNLVTCKEKAARTPAPPLPSTFPPIFVWDRYSQMSELHTYPPSLPPPFLPPSPRLPAMQPPQGKADRQRAQRHRHGPNEPPTQAQNVGITTPSPSLSHGCWYLPP